MSGTWTVFRAELWRVLRSRAAWVALLLVGGLSAMSSYGSRALLLAEGNPYETGAAWGPFAGGLRMGLIVSCIVLVAGAARLFASDLEGGLVRLAVTRSSSRVGLLLGRALLAPLVALPLVAVCALGAWLAARGELDFGSVVEEGYELMTAEELKAQFVIGLQAVLPAMLCAWVFGLTVGALSGSAAGAVGAALGAWIVFDLFKGSLLGENAFFLFASMAPTLSDSSALQGMPDLALGNSDGIYPEDVFTSGHLIVPAATALLLMVVTSIVLGRRRL